ncbi:MAG TPA: LamG domain-containing protein [Chthoniobacterales bacterium]|nr:LamG domain-containing protein [Chthoniobacterales bacterium]
MGTVAQIVSAVIQIAANYGGTLTQPTNYFNNPVTTGDAIVVFVSWLSTDGYVVSVTDSQSNLYLAVDPIRVGVTSTQTWVCYGARGGPCSVTATLSGFQSGAAIKLAEISGLSGALDATLTLNGTTANPTIGPITTKNADDMLIGLERGATPSAVGAGWTETDTQANNIQYRVVNAAGPYTARWTAPATNWNGGILAFEIGDPMNAWVTTDGYSTNGCFNATDPPSGFVCGNVLQYERTQPWTAMAAIKMFSKPPSEMANIIFTNVLAGEPYSGYEFWVDASGFLHVRIIRDIANNYIGRVGTTNVCDGNWHFVAATYDGSSSAAGVNIYLDGTLQPMTTESDTLTGSIVAAGQQMLIGNQNGRSSTFFARGYIDEFSIHNVVRSASYMAAISPTNLPQVDANVQLMYHFSEGDGIIAHDASGNHLNATFSIPQ